MSAKTIIGLGEVVWDLFDGGATRRAGGAPANVAFHATTLGHTGLLATAVGDDADGNELLEILGGRGVDVAHVRRVADRPTSLVDVHDDGDGPGYTIREDCAWDHLEAAEAWRDLFRAADAVCFGSLAQRTGPTRETIHACLAETSDDCLVVFDVNLRPPWWDRDVLARSIDRCTVLKLSDEELTDVAEAVGQPADDPERFAAGFGDASGKTIAVTLGGEGSVLHHNGRTVRLPVEPIEVVDTVGAGDAFTAGLIHALFRGDDAAAALAAANRLGGLVASSSGAMPDLGDRLAEI